MKNIKNSDKINSIWKGIWKNILNNRKLYIAMGISGVFAMQEDVAAQTYDDNSIKYTININNGIDYDKALNIRDQKISKLENHNDPDFDPKLYFVEVEKRRFYRNIENNKFWIGDKMSSIKNILNSEFNLNIDKDADGAQILYKALLQLSQEKKLEWLKKFTGVLSWEFDINMINAYGYIQSMFPEICVEKNWEKLPSWRLSASTLDRIIFLLKYGEYTIDLSWNRSQNTVTKKPIIKKESVEITEPKVERNTKTTKENWKISFENLGITKNAFENQEQLNLMLKENREIINSWNWNSKILKNKLNSDKLEWVSYQELINVVNSFTYENLRKEFMFHLLNNDIISAQELTWMNISCHKRYPDYIAKDKIDQEQLKKIDKIWSKRKYMSYDDILWETRIPNDVKNIYKKFVDKENSKFNNKWMNYSIISKSDCKLYMFSKDHKLLSIQRTLLGSTAGNQSNSPKDWINTTPSWFYEIWNATNMSSDGKKNFYKIYGSHYIVLVPKGGQIISSDVRPHTMWIHALYKNEYEKRLNWIKSNNTSDHRITHGCPNVYLDTFGELFNHLNIGSVIYITDEN